MLKLTNEVKHVYSHQKSTRGQRDNLIENMTIVLQVTIYRYLTTIEGVKPCNINVISQYNAQCNKLRKAFAEKELERVIVNTVSSSQGKVLLLKEE